MSLRHFTEATITDEPRRNHFIEVFGTATVPVIGIIPSLAKLPDFDEPQEVFQLNLKLLTEQQITALADYTAQKFDVQRTGLIELFIEEGYPVLAKGTILSTNMMFFL